MVNTYLREQRIYACTLLRYQGCFVIRAVQLNVITLFLHMHITTTKYNFKNYRSKLLLVIFTIILAYIVLLPLFVYSKWRKYIYADTSAIPHYHVAMVLGAGVGPDGEPLDMLQDRLDSAADLYESGTVDKLLVTGDNRVSHYNEPQAMINYLTEKRNIPLDDIIPDYAGRRTYDSCARAKRIFGLDEVLIISQGYHLPRALMLCNTLGVDAKGVSATRRSKYQNMAYFQARELGAIHKSLIDLYLWAPDYVGGEKIEVE